MHTDDVADLLYAKDQEIAELKQKLDHARTELRRVETEYARGL
jgi:hypothetical protein